jgi:GMP synthase (glutamine-hydrolysing)
MLEALGREERRVPVMTEEDRSGARKKPVLIVVHQVHSNPGHVGQWFRRNGYVLDIRRHYDGEPLPETLEHHCGAVIFGGPQSANDRLGFIRREVDWIAVPLAEKKPFLGICLGAQMLAHHLGGRVGHCPRGSVEIGYHRIRPTADGRRIGELPDHVYQWHREGFEVPRSGRLLAVGDNAYPHQAFSYGPAAIGLQFHPEITFAQVNRWSGGNSVRLLLRGAKPRDEHMRDHLVHATRVHSWLDHFLRNWVSSGLALA